MGKSYYSLGLMSGTSMDGVDASIIQSNGEEKYKGIIDKYYEYPKAIYKDLTAIRDKIKSLKDLNNFSNEIKNIEKDITLFHGKVANQILKKTKKKVDFIGFHGQTIFHDGKQKISRQLGDGKLLSFLTKKTIVYNFRKNDLKNGGQGAPLTPIFHKLLKEKLKIKQASFVNIGGIINTTHFTQKDKISGSDLGPGMCLIDKWMRLKLKKRYDKNGDIAKSGKINDLILKKMMNNFYKKRAKILKKNFYTISYDVQDFDLSLVKNLSTKDGAATLIQFAINMIHNSFELSHNKHEKIILTGGGRKNKFFVKKLKEKNDRIKLIDEYGIDGDFIESQAFAYLAIRSYLKLPISFPETTGVKKACTGGIVQKTKL
tara:strand:- start:1856 stop:2974 length:1119 start_codon:yes stop_codon:yes gene_type:complete